MNVKLPEFVNIAELARFLGSTTKTVKRHIENGNISGKKIDDQWKINLNQALEDWREKVNPNFEISKRATVEAVVGSPPTKVVGDMKSLADWKKEKEKWAAKKAQIEFEFKAGELVESKLVKQIAFETGRITRDNLMSFPDRLSHELAAEVDPKKISLILEEEIAKALDEISRVPEKLKKLTEEILKKKRFNDTGDD